MSDKVYITLVGVVQQFKGKDVVTIRENNNGQMAGFSVAGFATETKSGALIGGLFGCTIWPELMHVTGGLTEGMLVGIEGSYEANVSNGNTYHNVSVSRIAGAPAAVRQERPVVNEIVGQAPPIGGLGQQAATEAAPVAQAAAAAPATASPFAFGA